MAQFYGTLQGAKGRCSRLGNKHSGLLTEACSWQGKIQVWLCHKDGQDRYEIRQQPHHNRGVAKLIAEGIIGD
jgi:hypothetical protein